MELGYQKDKLRGEALMMAKKGCCREEIKWRSSVAMRGRLHEKKVDNVTIMGLTGTKIFSRDTPASHFLNEFSFFKSCF